MRGVRLMTERQRALGVLVAALLVASSFALETHNWNDLPGSITTGLLVVGLVSMVGLVLIKPKRQRPGGR